MRRTPADRASPAVTRSQTPRSTKKRAWSLSRNRSSTSECLYSQDLVVTSVMGVNRGRGKVTQCRLLALEVKVVLERVRMHSFRNAVIYFIEENLSGSSQQERR